MKAMLFGRQHKIAAAERDLEKQGMNERFQFGSVTRRFHQLSRN